MAVIETSELCYTYGAGTPFETKALDKVSFSVETGELIGIIGHTGSGKSTLIQHLNALLAPDSGRVLLNGRDINTDKASKRETRFKVGLCFQYPEYQLFESTVYDDIAYGPKNMKLGEAEIRDRVFEAMNYVGLSDTYSQRSPFDLSGGQKRRVAIAGVMAMRPEVFVLDEPTAGLDPAGRKMIFDMIAAYRKSTGSTIIIVSHSMDDIAVLADRILVLDHGSVFLYDTPKAVFSHSEELVKIGLDIPQTTALLIELKKRGYDVNTSLFSYEDTLAQLLRFSGRGGKK